MNHYTGRPSGHKPSPQDGPGPRGSDDRLEPAFIRRVAEAADLLAIVGSRTTLKKAGKQFVGLCPFHTERSPSFSVDPAKGMYHCFGCGAGGDAVAFLMEHDGLPFREVIEELASSAGIPMPVASIGARRPSRDSLGGAYAALEVATGFFERALRQSPEAITYARQRGLTGETAKRFRMGYAPAGWQPLSAAFPDYGRAPALVDAGLVAEKDGRRYDRFRERLIFPVRDLKGRVIAFGGRVLGNGEPKYLNSPETPVFNKGEILYGLYEAHAAQRGQRGRKTLFVVEGYMDVLALSQGGVPAAVATMGTAVSAAHIEQMRRLADEVVFVFDGDAAGDKAARAALEVSLPFAAGDTRFSFVRLPDGQDPDDVIQRIGRDAWLAQPRATLAEFLMSRAEAGCDLNRPDDRAAFLSEGKRLASLMPKGSDLRRIVLADLHRRAGLEPATQQSMRAQTTGPVGRRRFAATIAGPQGTRTKPAGELDQYGRIAEACKRQPQRTLELAPCIEAHLQAMFGEAGAACAPDAADAFPGEPPAVNALWACVAQARAGTLVATAHPGPTDVAILDNLPTVFGEIEEVLHARSEAAALSLLLERASIDRG